MREAEIRFMPKGQTPQVITVTQLGYGKMIYVKETKVDLKASDLYNKRHFEAVITANVPFKIVYEWLTEKQPEVAEAEEDNKLKDWLWVEKKNEPVFNLESARPKTYKVRFEWKMNPEWIERQAKINFQPLKEGLEADEEITITPILVTQAASPVITDDRAGDSLAIQTIHERLQSDIAFNFSENMMYWENVTLWKRTDKGLPAPEAVGRVRSVNFGTVTTKESLPQEVKYLKYLETNVTLWKRTDKGLPAPEAVGRVRSVNFGTVTTKESLPQEVKYLKYLETFQVYGNANTMLLNIALENHICELKHLKNLQIGGYGLVSLPEDFKKLGETLVSLDLSANNFTAVPAILTKENFPALRKLMLNGNRRWTVNSLKDTQYNKDTDLGFHINMNEDPREIDQLFLWDTLEELVLSYNYLEGSLPTYEGRTEIPVWKGDELPKDTLSFLKDKNIPKILPNAKRLTLNLNYFTGELPKWILYHPHLLDWFPEVLIFNQQEMGRDSKGAPVKFSNAPTNFEYYFKAYPLYKGKYEVAGDDEIIKPE